MIKISELALNPYISDVQLKLREGQPESNFQAHKFLLATQSHILNPILKDHPKVLTIVIPKPIQPIKRTPDISNVQSQQRGYYATQQLQFQQSPPPTPEDLLTKVLQLAYLFLENPEKTKQQVFQLANKNNCFAYYALCQTLGFESIRVLFEKHVVQHMNRQDDAISLLLDSMQYESDAMREAALDMIVPKFQDFLRSSYLFNQVIDLPFNAFKALIQRDDLSVPEESDVFNIVYQYILKRESDDPPEDEDDQENNQKQLSSDKLTEKIPSQSGVPPAVENTNTNNNPKWENDPQFKEENNQKDPKQQVQQPPPPEGEQPKEQEKQQPSDQKEEPPKDQQEALKVEDNQPKQEGDGQPQEPSKESDQQINGNNENIDETIYYMPDNMIELASKRIKNYKLTIQQKSELLLSLRLGYISHDNLLKYSNLDLLQPFKEIFLYAVSSKLNYFDNQEFLQKYSFNLDPRLSYSERVNNLSILQNHSQNTLLKGMDSKRASFSPLNQQVLQQSPQQQLRSNEETNRKTLHPIQPQTQPKSRESVNNVNNINNNNPFSLVDPSISQGFSSLLAFTQSLSQFQQQQHLAEQQQQQQQSQNPSSTQRNLLGPQKRNGSFLNNVQSLSPIHPSSFNNLNQVASGAPPLSMTSRQQSAPEFVYKYDMDDNGVLYYLGTFGKTKPYVNPHTLGQVQAFASSIRAGKAEYFVGREPQNLSTYNEKKSFFGIDLGEDRSLYPTAYTIVNRNSSTYVLLNWVLEASADGRHYMPIDKRVHYDPDDDHFNNQAEKEREALKISGAASSYGIDEFLLKRILKDNSLKAFRYFRVVQITKNSNGSDNLNLGGFEIYGIACGQGW